MVGVGVTIAVAAAGFLGFRLGVLLEPFIGRSIPIIAPWLPIIGGVLGVVAGVVLTTKLIGSWIQASKNKENFDKSIAEAKRISQEIEEAFDNQN